MEHYISLYTDLVFLPPPCFSPSPFPLSLPFLFLCFLCTLTWILLPTDCTPIYLPSHVLFYVQLSNNSGILRQQTVKYAHCPSHLPGCPYPKPWTFYSKILTVFMIRPPFLAIPRGTASLWMICWTCTLLPPIFSCPFLPPLPSSAVL